MCRGILRVPAKTSLKKVLGKSFVTYEELGNLFCDTEAVINSQSFIYVSEDDLVQSLTPYHFTKYIQKNNTNYLIIFIGFTKLSQIFAKID